MMGRHIIIVGPPGIGKTTLAKNVARILPEIKVIKGCKYNCAAEEPICPECKQKKSKETIKISGEKRFVRVQGSPDLTAEDLIGDIDPIKAIKYGPLSIEAFTPGKIFKANNGILFFDEVNRCPEKLQNAMLQVLAEKTATVGSYEVDMPANLIFIGTMNPEDYSATEQMSEVFMDRFDIIYMNYPETIQIEKKIIKEKSETIKEIEFPEDLFTLMTYFVRSLRESKDLERKPSVRASMGLYERAQSNAMLEKRKQVEMKDIEESITSVLSHRIKLKPSIRYLQTGTEFIKEEFQKFLNSKEAQRILEEKETEPG
jgi:Mg-chelatase subunit ChlI